MSDMGGSKDDQTSAGRCEFMSILADLETLQDVFEERVTFTIASPSCHCHFKISDWFIMTTMVEVISKSPAANDQYTGVDAKIVKKFLMIGM